MEFFKSESSPENKLYKLLFEVKILKNKSIFDRARKMAEFGFEKTKQFGFFLLEQQFLIELQFIAIENDEINRYDVLKENNLEIFTKIFEYQQISHSNQELITELKKLNIRNGYYPEIEKQIRIENIFQIVKKRIKENSEIKDLPERILLENLFLEYFCLLSKNLYEEAKQKFIIFLERYENSFVIKTEPDEYLYHINLAITISVLTHDLDLVTTLEQKIDTYYSEINPKIRSNNFVKNYLAAKNNIIAFFTHIEKFEIAKIKSEQIYTSVLKLNFKPSLQKIFLANLCQIYLCCRCYKDALKTFNSVMNNKKYSEIREDINPGMNILGLAIFYELGHSNNFESFIRHCKRSKNFGSEIVIYKKIIEFFSELSLAKDKLKAKDLFKNIFDLIIDFENLDAGSRFFIENTRISYWIKEKYMENK